MPKMYLALLLALMAGTLLGSAQEKPAVDALGDPLPAGAVQRLGTTRYRHGGMPTGVVFLDATTLTSTGTEGVMRYWDVPSGRQIREVGGLSYQRQPLVHEGKVLLATEQSHHFTAWDVRTGKKLRSFGYGPVPCGAGLRKDTVFLATNTEVSLWDFDQPKATRTLIQDDRLIHGLALSGEGSVLAVSHGQKVRLWDVPAMKERAPLTCPGAGEHYAYHLAFVPGKSNVLAVMWGDHKTRLVDLDTGKELRVFDAKWATSLAFAPDGKTLALGGKWDEDGLRLLDLATGETLWRYVGIRHQAAQSLAFSPDGKYLAAGGVDNVVQVFEAATGKAVHANDGMNCGVRDMALSPDGKLLSVNGEWLEMTLWDMNTGQLRGRVPQDLVGVVAGVGNDGRVLVGRCGSFEATFYWHNVVTGADEKLFRLPKSLHWATLCPDQKVVALMNNGGELSLWNLAQAKEYAAPQRAESESYYGLAVSSDGKRLATSRVVREVATGELVRSLKPGHQTTVNDVAFSRDGKQVATVSTYGVRIYETDGHGPPRIIEEPTKWAWCVAFHPKGRWLAVGGHSEIALVDLASGKVERRLTGHRGIVRRLLFTPDGKHLLSGGSDASVIVWDANW